MTRDLSSLARGTARFDTWVVLLVLGAAACGGELNVGSSEVPPGDAGLDAATDSLTQVAADMAGTWIGTLLIGTPFEMRLTMELTYKPEKGRGGEWALSCNNPPQECSENQLPPWSADAGPNSPLDAIRMFLSRPQGDYWVHQFSEKGPQLVDGTLTSGLGAEFELNLAQQTLDIPLVGIRFRKGAADAGARP